MSAVASSSKSLAPDRSSSQSEPATETMAMDYEIPQGADRVDVFIPTDNSLITEILMETQPLEKIEKNLFGQYLKAQEPVNPNQMKRQLPKFLSKVMAE